MSAVYKLVDMKNAAMDEYAQSHFVFNPVIVNNAGFSTTSTIVLSDGRYRDFKIAMDEDGDQLWARIEAKDGTDWVGPMGETYQSLKNG